MTQDKSNAMWGGRFAAGPDAIMEAINASIGFDQRLASQDIRGSRAHAAMLANCGIISPNDAEAIREGLLTVLSEIEGGTFAFSTALGRHSHECRGAPERDRRRTGGPSAHRAVRATIRSRPISNCGSAIRWTRPLTGSGALIEALLEQAEAGADWVMPGFTHLQTAQPVTWGHHMLAYVEMFGRDQSRFKDARARMNESALGRRRTGRHVLCRSTGSNDRGGSRVLTVRRPIRWMRCRIATLRWNSCPAPRSARCTSAALPKSW